MCTQEVSNVQLPEEKKTAYDVEICSMDMDSDNALSQYEALRKQIIKRPDFFPECSLGLALFIRRGMLAWIDICQRYIPVTPSLKKEEPPALANEMTSEMIKIMANITLFNLEEALS